MKIFLNLMVRKFFEKKIIFLENFSQIKISFKNCQWSERAEFIMCPRRPISCLISAPILGCADLRFISEFQLLNTSQHPTRKRKFWIPYSCDAVFAIFLNFHFSEKNVQKYTPTSDVILLKNKNYFFLAVRWC